MKNGFRLVLALVAALSLSLGATAAEPLRVGGLFSITGPASFIGEPERNAMLLAIERINAQGGIEGRMLEAVIYDTTGDARKAVNFYKRLVKRDGVDIIVGPSLSGSSIALRRMVARDSHVTLLSCGASEKIVKPIMHNVFKTAQSDRLAVQRIYGWLREQGKKNIGLLTVTSGFGQSGEEQLHALANEYGMNIVAAEKYAPADTDMTGQLLKIADADPDFLIIWDVNPGPAIIARNMQQLGLDMPVVNSHGVASHKYIELAGDASEGVVMPASKVTVFGTLKKDHEQWPALDTYIRAYGEKYDSAPSHFGAHSWDAIMLIAAALRDNPDTGALSQTLVDIDPIALAGGVFDFTDEDHEGLQADAFSLVRIRNADWEVVEH